MRSPDLLDFDRLQTPISEESPGGDSLRNDPLRDNLSAARKAKRAVLESEADQDPDWAGVIDLAHSALCERSKDLEIACWLTEALLHRHGAAGLRDGLRTVQILMDQFWDVFHPLVEDEDDIELRAARLEFLTDANSGPRIPYAVRIKVPVASSHEDELITLDFADPLGFAPRRESEDDEAFERRRIAADQQADRTRSAIAETSDDFYVTLNSDLDECFELINRIDAMATEKMGYEAPGWSALRESLAEVQTFVRRILSDRHIGEETVEGVDESQNGAPGAAGGGSRGPIRSRAEAIQRLKECAVYLRQNDPHSMVASLVERAIHWAEMPLSQVLNDLIRDSSALENIRETLGIPANSGHEE